MNNNPYNLSKKELLKIHRQIIKDSKSKYPHKYSNCDILKLIIIVVLFYVLLIFA